MKTKARSVTQAQELNLFEESSVAITGNNEHEEKKSGIWRFFGRVGEWMKKRKNYLSIFTLTGIVAIIAVGIAVELITSSSDIYDAPFTDFAALFLGIVAGIIPSVADVMNKKARSFLGLIGASFLFTLASLSLSDSLWSLAVLVIFLFLLLILGTTLWCKERVNNHPNGGAGFLTDCILSLLSPVIALAILYKQRTEDFFTSLKLILRARILYPVV